MDSTEGDGENPGRTPGATGPVRLHENWKSPTPALPASGIGTYTSWFLLEVQNPPSPLVGEGRGRGGERRLTFPPPSQPSPIKGEGVRFFDCSFGEGAILLCTGAVKFPPVHGGIKGGWLPHFVHTPG